MNNNEYATHWRQAVPLPKGVLGKARNLCRHTILSACSLVKRTTEKGFLRGLYCHYVFDDQLRDFERMISRLKRQGRFIDTETCIDMLRGKKEIDGRYFHLSFDDGFRNNFTNALPILQKHEIPAMFFVPSSLIGADWETTKAYCLETTKYNAVIEMLTWEDIKHMVSLGYEIGSHTKTHARFSEISQSAQKLEDEILGSKLELENNLGQECKYISWPYGTRTDADESSLSMARSAGYQACFGAYRGTMVPGKTDLFTIPRHHFEAHWPLAHVEYFARGNMEGET